MVEDWGSHSFHLTSVSLSSQLKSKRTRCDEAALVDVIDRLRHKRQAQYSRAHRRYLDRRTLFELADLMTPARLKPEELAGRISGDSMWKASRGEQVANDVSYVGQTGTSESERNLVCIDVY